MPAAPFASIPPPPCLPFTTSASRPTPSAPYPSLGLTLLNLSPFRTHHASPLLTLDHLRQPPHHLRPVIQPQADVPRTLHHTQEPRGALRPVDGGGEVLRHGHRDVEVLVTLGRGCGLRGVCVNRGMAVVRHGHRDVEVLVTLGGGCGLRGVCVNRWWCCAMGTVPLRFWVKTYDVGV